MDIGKLIKAEILLQSLLQNNLSIIGLKKHERDLFCLGIRIV